MLQGKEDVSFFFFVVKLMHLAFSYAPSTIPFGPPLPDPTFEHQ